jgi:hypothetical protein
VRLIDAQKNLTAIFSLWAINRGGVLAMAEVEHQGDFVSMLKSAWEPSNSLVLVNQELVSDSSVIALRDCIEWH